MLGARAESAPEDIAPEQVLEALDRLLSSEEFRHAQRSRDFLAYVVTETLAGRGDRLSERTVGRRALGKGADFDGSTTAAVRVRASRVRSALRRYYAAEGAAEQIRVSVPPGRLSPWTGRTPTRTSCWAR